MHHIKSALVYINNVIAELKFRHDLYSSGECPEYQRVTPDLLRTVELLETAKKELEEFEAKFSKIYKSLDEIV